MGTLVDMAATRHIASYSGEVMRTAAERSLPKGCKGAACPAFALCRGRCSPAQDEGVFVRNGERHEAR